MSCGACYFSVELQGEYVMQTVVAGSQVQYSTVHVNAEAIPVWGMCQHRQGDIVILNDSYNGTACVRCFHLKLHSANVLQVHTCPTCLEKCYLSEEAARSTCPQAHNLAASKEITLFRTQEPDGRSIRKLFCPINGHFWFTHQTDNRVECDVGQSQLVSCAEHTGDPLLNVQLQTCLHQNKEMKFECLGDWAGPGDQRFLALLDTSTSVDSERQPQYRCAIYREDELSGNIMIAFSSDSTCTTDLHNASSGYLTWNLTPASQPAHLPTAKCSFPKWSQGKWENFHVNQNMINYKDHMSFNSHKMYCDQAHLHDTFVVYSTNGCGEEVYKCIRLKHRSTNVLEFQIGNSSSSSSSNSLCSDSNFPANVWVTQARLEGLQVSPCPVTGEYSGFIPNNAHLCARLASDQLHPETMYFTVSDCEQLEVYEEREYKCLGQWKEDGVTYTYTQRKDFGTYECFVGSIVSHNEIYIKEAGEHCGRGIDPMRLGMKLQSKGSSFPTVVSSNKLPEPSPPPSAPVTSWFATSAPTKPWKPITAPPKHSGARRSVLSAFAIAALTLLSFLC